MSNSLGSGVVTHRGGADQAAPGLSRSGPRLEVVHSALLNGSAQNNSLPTISVPAASSHGGTKRLTTRGSRPGGFFIRRGVLTLILLALVVLCVLYGIPISRRLQLESSPSKEALRREVNRAAVRRWRQQLENGEIDALEQKDSVSRQPSFQRLLAFTDKPSAALPSVALARTTTTEMLHHAGGDGSVDANSAFAGPVNASRVAVGTELHRRVDIESSHHSHVSSSSEPANVSTPTDGGDDLLTRQHIVKPADTRRHDRNRVAERWPSGHNIRRKRRYSENPPSAASVLEKHRRSVLLSDRNAADKKALMLWLTNSNQSLGVSSSDVCPPHRSQGVFGFLPRASALQKLPPIDSVISVTFQGRADPSTLSIDVVRAMMSRSEVDSSEYHRFVPLGGASPPRQSREDNSNAAQLNRSQLAVAAMCEVIEPAPAGRTASLSSTPAPSSAAARIVAQPLQVDVVITYVNGTAPSMKSNMQKRGVPYDPNRYQDWNELQYAMRSIYHRMVCLPGTGIGSETFSVLDAADENIPSPPFIQQSKRGRRRQQQSPRQQTRRRRHVAPCIEGTFVRKIHLVVADRDQVPDWLNQSHPMISIVTHKHMFPSLDGPEGRTYPHLPTFNSHAIELQLHKIPGLARFFIYLNNDMLFGRRVSLFDYFRPISGFRSEWRSETGASGGGGLADRSASSCASLLMQSNSGGGGESTTLLFEPIVYGESMARSCQPVRRRGAAKKLFDALASAEVPTSSISNRTSHSCAHHPVRPSFLYNLRCFYVTKREHDADALLRKVNFLNRLAFDRLDGLAVVHSFAHYPQLFDRLLVERFVEVDFRDMAEVTRQNSVRTDYDLWLTLLYGTYALAHRMAIDTEAEAFRDTLLGRQQHAAASAAWRPVQWLDWANRQRAYELQGSSSNTTRALTDPARRRAKGAAEESTLWDAEFDDDNIAEHLHSLGRNFFRTDGWLPPRWRFASASDGVSSAALSHKGALGARFNISWMSSDALLSCGRRTVCTSIVKEKLHRHVVYVFEKVSSYRFCQIFDAKAATGCIRDAVDSTSGTGTRLFWTLNDDWGLSRHGHGRRRRRIPIERVTPQAADDDENNGEQQPSQKVSVVRRSRARRSAGRQSANESVVAPARMRKLMQLSLPTADARQLEQPVHVDGARHERPSRLRLSATRRTTVHPTSADATPGVASRESGSSLDATSAPPKVDGGGDVVDISVAAKFMNDALRIITRGASPAPWELTAPAEDVVANETYVLGAPEAARDGATMDSDVPQGQPRRIIRGRQGSVATNARRLQLRDPYQKINWLAMAAEVQQSRLGELSDISGREDIHTFLFREWTLDRNKPKDAWLTNLLDEDYNS